MGRRRACASVVAVALFFGQVVPAAASGLGANAASMPPGRTNIDANLLAELKTGDGRFVVEFAAKADLKGAAKLKDRADRGQYVLDKLTATADTSQQAALALVDGTSGARATGYWLTNVMVVEGSAALATKLAALPGVTSVRPEKTYAIVEPVKPDPIVVAAAIGNPDWGGEMIGADEVWGQGVIGAGIVVANIDTGVEYNHPALVNQYRGNLGPGLGFDHDFNWFDPTGTCTLEPCDNVAHGTHTMGTIVGGDGPGPFSPDIGIAPGATWIAAKGCEDFGCSEESLLAAGQFVVAPTDLTGDPATADPSKAPHIVSNSWGGAPDDPFYIETVAAWHAAGIIPVFANGNSGPGCGTVSAPGSFANVIGVGATDMSDQIAEFSSRGPSPSGPIKPDISAPGDGVLSSVPGGGYEAFSGTSMATPHVAGALALVLSANDALVGDYAGARAAITTTAVDKLDDSCGGDASGDPNNVYGEGRLDAFAAVDQFHPVPNLSGTITAAATTTAIAGARVTASDGVREFSTVTNGSGDYVLLLAPGTYLVSAEAFGYFEAARPGVEVPASDVDLALELKPRFHVRGVVSAIESGAPIRGALVRALGTPVPPYKTGTNGRYDLYLPIGDYTLQASASGGCSEALQIDVSIVDTNLTGIDFALLRKLDRFGHGCRQIGFNWVDAKHQTALFGDDLAGRLRLPFTFSFYGRGYDQLHVSSNGNVNFLEPNADFFPSAIPSTGVPNAAIYALWRDLVIGDAGAIEYDVTGSAPNRAFVIEWSDVNPFGSALELDIEMKIRENGTIDLLYGANSANPGDGRDATIGIEDHSGSDALQFSFFEASIGQNVAYRYEMVPSGLVTGLVTDSNDDEPIAGATISVSPTGQTITTDSDGMYSLRLRPGTYTLTAEAPNYESASSPPVPVIVDGNHVVYFSLNAAIAEIAPLAVAETVEFGSTATVDLTIANPGSATLTWSALERDTGLVVPPLPPIPTSVTRRAVWSRVALPANFPTAVIGDIPDVPLTPIINDPAGDAINVDITTVRAASDGSSLVSMGIDFTPATDMSQVVGFVFFDTDQDPTTGLPASEFFGRPEQDVGMEFFADLFAIHDPEPVVFIVSAITFEVVAVVPATITGQRVQFDVPLEALGDDDGSLNTAMALGDFVGPTDWAPDEGHGVIAPFRDAPWLSVDPTSGEVPAGGPDGTAALTLGTPTTQPGDYTAQVAFVSNAPKHEVVFVDVALTVVLPEEFGAIAGTVSDAHTGDPIVEASVTVDAVWDAQPVQITSTTGDDGSYTLIGPEGVWQTGFAAAGYLSDERTVTITRGVTTSGVDAALHQPVPHATLEPGELTFVLTEGRQGETTLGLANGGGHVDLTFETAEVNLGAGIAAAATTRPLPSGVNPNARTSRGIPSVTVNVPPALMADGDVVRSWPTGLDLPWGVGFSNNVWISDVFENGDVCGFLSPDSCLDVEFSRDGPPPLGSFPTPWVDVFPADMAYDRGRNLIWQLNVGGDNGIYGLDPADGSVDGGPITGSPWSDISQRGLAYDPAGDVFYVGGWNEGVIYQVAGPGHGQPGETLGQCNPPDPTISGLAWNPAFGLLWEATNSETDTIYLLDPVTCEAVRSVPHPDGGGFNGAGLELDVTGDLWTVGQASGNAYLIESGLPIFSDVPWLAVAPASGSVAPDGNVGLDVAVDSTGLDPGAYRAMIVVLTNDPANSAMTVPVTLVVPAYQQGVNAGGPQYVGGHGDVYAADQQYTTGSFGYDGSSTTRSTSQPIAGTEDGPLLRDLRANMDAYRFDVANGRYRVDLHFAELLVRRDLARVFAVRIEGETVLPALDVFATAGGRFIAISYSFEVDVADGTLDIEFVPPRRHVPIVNAILVIDWPMGAGTN